MNKQKDKVDKVKEVVSKVADKKLENADVLKAKLKAEALAELKKEAREEAKAEIEAELKAQETAFKGETVMVKLYKGHERYTEIGNTPENIKNWQKFGKIFEKPVE